MSKGVTIKGDDDEIGYKVLAWAGLDDLWDEHQLGDDHNPYSDVLTWCGSLDIESEEYDYDRPGASGNNYTVWIGDPKKAKAELLQRLRILIAEKKSVRGPKTLQ